MTLSDPMLRELPAPRALSLILDFVELCIEDPVGAARSVARAIALAAIAISAAATMVGTGAALGFALFYAGSAWALVYCLQKSRECVPDAR
jgi:hypothetical protein